MRTKIDTGRAFEVIDEFLVRFVNGSLRIDTVFIFSRVKVVAVIATHNVSYTFIYSIIPGTLL
jgi:hypothetical protein